MQPDELRARVAASRAAQGLSPTITDPVAVRRVARLVLSNEKAAGALISADGQENDRVQIHDRSRSAA